MIKFESVSYRYPNGTGGIEAIDLKVNSGEIVYLTGASGSGKTTVLKLLERRIVQDTGELSVEGCPLKQLSAREVERYRQRIGIVFQDFRLLEALTVEENIALSVEVARRMTSEDILALTRLLEAVGLTDKRHSTMDTLSYGEKQRVAIARALMRSPRLIIADEPTGNLDETNAVGVLKLMTSLKSPDQTVVITTHTTHLLKQLPQGRHLHMREGRLEEL
ncbi:cell division ATP-binding protein FtsE [Fusibacter sp. JL298sf-3]